MAPKDIQIIGTLTNSNDESSNFARNSIGQSEGMTSAIVIAAISRQWLPILLATVVSAAIAYCYSTAYSQLTFTAHLVLSKQLLPATSRAVYEAQDPRRASTLLTSTQVLQPVCNRHELADTGELKRQIVVTPDADTSSISVQLHLNERNRAIQLLNEIGKQFEVAILDHRNATLAEHASHVAALQKKATVDLGLARTDLLNLQGSMRLNRENGGHPLDDLQGLLNRHSQMASSLEECVRKQAKIQRELQFWATEFRAVQTVALSEILNGRRQQAERMRQRVTNESTIAQAISDVLTELTGVANELNAAHKTIAVDSYEIGKPVRLTNLAQGFQEGSGNRLPDQTKADCILHWAKRISAIGHEALGNLSPETLEAVELATTKLENMTDEENRLLLEFKTCQSDAEHFRSKFEEVESDLDRILRLEAHSKATTLLDLQLDVSQKEARQTELKTQLEQINQLANYESPEYCVSSPAHLDPMSDIKSNRKKLFVFVFAAIGLLLYSPSIFVELRRLRPNPVHVISQRWHLPILDHSSVASVARTTQGSDAARSTNHELRLMALRIQQSLCQPEGRVVLFSGLDHEESPLMLILPLAECLADREESVLIVETMPADVIRGTSSPHDEPSQTTYRPGVADFLHGDYSDADSLVICTETRGVDFLPGGSTAFASEAIASRRLTAMIDGFRRSYSLIILCGPSTLNPADLQMLAARADGIVFTVNRQSMHDVYGNEVIRDLIELGAPILGFAAQPSREANDASKQLTKSDKFAVQTAATGC